VKVGVVGLGGLGHMGVKFARAFGAHVVVFTTSPGKKEDALRLGAHEVVLSRNADEMKKHAASFDFILGRRSFSGSPIGGIAETQEMLDFCGTHSITVDVEVIPIQKVNEAYERLTKSDVKYRFSIDMASLKSA
jgi:alcohol dehydrogenase (NADP+)